jgi:hypothetical protein
VRLRDKPSCDTCKKMHEQKGELPDCETCLPELMPSNQDALNVYQSTQNQLIMSFGGPISINHLAVWEWIDRYGINDPINVFEKVCATSANIISDMNEESRLEREANKSK